MIRSSIGRALMAVVMIASPAPYSIHAEDTDLASGIRQAQQGEFDAAVITLDRAIQRLTAAGGPAPDLARAYVYRAVAEIGLGQDAKARESFLKARAKDPHLRLNTDEFPPRIVQAYDQALASAGLTSAGSAPTTAATVPAAEPQKKGGGSKTLWVIAGLGAVGAGVAVAAGGGGGDPPPAATPTPQPPDISGRWVGMAPTASS